jgi:ectoine hydroxylase-related dioxygenase (phytanoyl-CoA dioxygenase family)
VQAITDTAITFDEALASLGVTQTTLTFEQKEHLDSQGYAAWLNELRELFELLVEQEGQLAGHEVHQEKGARRLADLVNKSPACDGIYTHPQVLAAVYHILGRAFKIFSLNGRDALPGYGLQGLHSDWGRRNAAEPYHLVNSIWLLDDFTPENGATRLVPGTHRMEGSPG